MSVSAARTLYQLGLCPPTALSHTCIDSAIKHTWSQSANHSDLHHLRGSNIYFIVLSVQPIAKHFCQTDAGYLFVYVKNKYDNNNKNNPSSLVSHRFPHRFQRGAVINTIKETSSDIIDVIKYRLIINIYCKEYTSYLVC